MPKWNLTLDQKRRVVIKLLKRGVLTQSEAAKLAAVSRQNVQYWVRYGKLNPMKARQERLLLEWMSALAEI